MSKSKIAGKFGGRIRELRKAQGMTQALLSERADLSENYLGAIERGTRTPSLETIGKISGALKVKVRDLFDFHENGSYPMEHEEALTKFYGYIKEKKTDDVYMVLDIAKRVIDKK